MRPALCARRGCDSGECFIGVPCGQRRVGGFYLRLSFLSFRAIDVGVVFWMAMTYFGGGVAFLDCTRQACAFRSRRKLSPSRLLLQLGESSHFYYVPTMLRTPPCSRSAEYCSGVYSIYVGDGTGNWEQWPGGAPAMFSGSAAW